MTGGEPPLPPSRNPYPPWQGRGYRRRGGGPTGARNGWVGRRPRSPPPSARPRHPRGAPHRHHRHIPQPHQSSQPHSHAPPYHHHGPPPLPRNLQGRLRSPPRSPPPRRPDLNMHRDEPPRGEQLRGERDRLDPHRGDVPRGEPHRGEPLRGESHRADTHRGEPHRGEPHRGDTSRVEQHRNEHRGDQHSSEQHRSDQHRADHSYRGEPGPSHRIDPPDRAPYRGAEPYAPPRGPPPKARGELGPFRAEQRPQRGSGDHHVPYRGEPGPLYRADLSSHRDDMEARRGPVDGAPSRGDLQSYGPWFRHPSKIHKPVKRKMRRHPPHIGGVSRPLQLSKPESPILSRMSFPHAERGIGKSKTDALLTSSACKPTSNFPKPPVLSQWHSEPSPRFTSPRPHNERTSMKTFEKGIRALGGSVASASSLSKRQSVTVPKELLRSSTGDSVSVRSGGLARKSSGVGKSPVSEEQDTLPPMRSPEAYCNGQRREGLDNNVLKRASGDRTALHMLTPDGPEKLSCSAMPERNPTMLQERRENSLKDGNSLKALKGASTCTKVAGKADLKIPIANGDGADVGLVTSKRRTSLSGGIGPSAPNNSTKNDSLRHVAHLSSEGRSDGTPEKAQGMSLSGLSMDADKLAKAGTPSMCHFSSPFGFSSTEASRVARPVDKAKKESQDGSTPSVPETRQISLSEPASVDKSTPSTASIETVPMKRRSVSVPRSHQSPAEELQSPQAPVASAIAIAKKEDAPGLQHRSLSGDSSQRVARARVPQSAGVDVAKPCSLHPSTTRSLKEKTEEVKGMGRSAVLKGQSATTTSAAPQVPVLPNVNLRSMLTSALHQSSNLLSRPATVNTSRDGLRSLPPASPIKAKSVDAKTSAGSKRNLESINSEADVSVRATSLGAPALVSVPAPAISFLRSSPRSRVRGTVADLNSAKKSIGLQQSPALSDAKQVDKAKSGSSAPVTDTLEQRIHEIEKQISAVERKLGQQLAMKRIASERKVGDVRIQIPEVKGETIKNEDLRVIASIARSVAAKADERAESSIRLSHEPLHSNLRLVMVHNQAKASAARAALRPLCHDPEIGLLEKADPGASSFGQSSEEVLRHVASVVASRKEARLEKMRRLSSEYISLRESWLRKLKSARDKKSKEKREALKERDRFLVLRTKGHSALLTSRTSSGRMSTKIIPSLNSNGQMNGNAEVDALLAEIAAEGGTPGSKDIWSKTLVDIPDQDPSWVPCDNTSVLVQDPIGDFHASRFVNPWMFEEKLVFLEKYVVYSKNFRKIASFLEYKSTRECAQFYYANKLDLGLKQLAKEASTLKRKGALKSHLVEVAKKRISFESVEAIAARSVAFLSAHTLVNGSSTEKGLNSEVLSDMGGRSDNHQNERRQVQPMRMALKKRIMAEDESMDMSGIDFEKFSRAVAIHGTNWKEVMSTMAVAGKSSTHYREFYRRNRRKLRVADSLKLRAGRNTSLSRSPTPLRYSPRTSPRGSPSPSPSPPQRRLTRGISAGELEPLLLNDGADVEVPVVNKRKHRKNASPLVQSPDSQPKSSPDIESNELPGAAAVETGENVIRKGRFCAWTAEEGEKFRLLFKRYGRDWKKIAHIMTPKTPTQVKGYWRKVAHEVGNGLPSDATKSSRNEKKRPRKSSSFDGTVKGSLVDEKKSPVSWQSGTSHEPSKRGAKRARSSSDDPQDLQVESTQGDATSFESKSLVGKGSAMNGNAHSILSSRALDSNGDLRALSTSLDEERNKHRSDEDSAPKKVDTRVLSNSRLPSLRSAPAPMFRSVLVSKRMPDVPATGSPDGLSGASYSEQLGVDESSKRTEEAPRHVQRVKASEAFGMMELLGSRLEGASNTQRPKR